MTKPNCPYCGLVLKHHARAAEHAALVNKVLDDRIRGQYPGLAPGQVPQIGYQYGAPLSPSFQQFQSQQVNQAVQGVGEFGHRPSVRTGRPVLECSVRR